MKPKKTINLTILHALVLPLLGMLAASSHAEGLSESHPFFTDKLFFDVGIFFPNRKFDIKVNGTAAVSNERHDFGVGVGIHWLEVGAFIEGNATMGAGTISFRRESVSAGGPLGNIGAQYLYSISPRWVFKGRVDWLEASVGDYAGGIVNASVGVNVRVTDHFGAGVNYNYLDLDVDVNKPDWRGRLETRYKGFFGNMSFSW